MSTPKKLPDINSQYFGFLLSKAMEQVIGEVEEQIADFQITSRHFGILALIANSKALQQIEIARELRIDRTTMVKFIDELEKLKLIERKRHPEDRRAYAIYLTKKGETLLPEITNIAKQAEQSAVSNLTEDEAKELHRLLVKLLV